MAERKYEALTTENAPEVYRLIADLVKKHHASDLADARVGAMYVYDVKPDRDEKTWWGKARKVAPKEQEYHRHDFVIELNYDVWRTLLPEQQRAVMDHELCHCGRAETEDGESVYYLRKHDLEEFSEIVERYGVKWRPAVEEFIRRATGQTEPTLFDAVEPEAASAPTPLQVVANGSRAARLLKAARGPKTGT